MERNFEYHVPAVVLGGGITGLGIVRNLGRNGVPVFCVVERPEQVLHSRYCTKSYVIPNIEKDSSKLRDFLVAFENRLDGAVLFPTSDLYSVNLSEIMGDFGNNYHPLVPRVEVTRTLVEKKRFYKSISDFKVPHPKTFYPESIKNIKDICNELKFPVYIKPSLSQVFAEKFGAKGFKARNALELLKYYNLVTKHKIDVVVQEIIPGLANYTYGVAGYFDENCLPKAFFAYHRLRAYPPVFGTSSLIESFSISYLALIKDVIKDYLHQLGYHGIMESEFKMDPRDGLFKLIEINARSWWQNSLPTRCGLNIVMIAYLDAIGAKTKYSENYEEGIKWLYLPNDVASVILAPPSIKDWMHSLQKTKDWAYFAIDDWLPWIASSKETLSSSAKRIFTVLK